MMRQNSFWDHILSVVWMYVTIFPAGNLFNISIPLLLLLLFDSKSRTNIMTPLLVMLLITLVLNLTQPYMWFKGVSRLVTIAIIFYTFASLKGGRILFPYIFAALIYVISSQISYMYNISFLTTIFDRFYGMSDMIEEIYRMELDNVTMEDVASGRRFGGIYINPNNCASFVSVIYTLGLCELNYWNEKNKIVYIFIVLVAFSLLLTGSRTSFILFSIITLLFFRNKGIGVTKIVVLVLAVLILLSKVDIGGYRAFKVGEGLDSSFAVKMRLFSLYFQECSNILHLLFGCGDISATTVLYHSLCEGTDFDFGNVFITFGLFFYILYVALYFRIYHTLPKQDRIILLVLLWSFSNSILISFRMCPVWFISIGVLYKRALMYTKEKRIIKTTST